MRLSLYLMALAGANIVLGFGYNWYLLTWLGPGRPTDALFAGMMIPQVLAAVVGGALTNALVPMLSVEAASRRALLGWTFAQAVLLATGGGAILLALAAPLWVPLTVPAFDADAVRLTIHLLRVQLIGVVLLSVATVQRAIHNAAHRYIWVEVTGLIATVAGLGVLVGGLRVWGVEAAAWATVAKAVLHGTLLLPAMGSYHGPAWGRPELRRAWQRLWPLMAGSLYYKSDVVLDRTLGSLAAPGVLSVYHLAHQAYASAQLVLGKAIVGPAVPALGRAAERGDWTVFRRITRRRLAAVLLIAIAGFIALVLVG
nr:virulence factor MviN [Gemmatimonadales bacterium]